MAGVLESHEVSVELGDDLRIAPLFSSSTPPPQKKSNIYLITTPYLSSLQTPFSSQGKLFFLDEKDIFTCSWDCSEIPPRRNTSWFNALISQQPWSLPGTHSQLAISNPRPSARTEPLHPLFVNLVHFIHRSRCFGFVSGLTICPSLPLPSSNGTSNRTQRPSAEKLAPRPSCVRRHSTGFACATLEGGPWQSRQ